MASGSAKLENILLRADEYLAKGQTHDAWLVVFYAQDDYFFSEALHDRLGACNWARAEECSRLDRRKGIGRVDSPFHRMGERAQAGLHWILSGEEDDVRNRWRQDPENLFRAFRFPELPFDRFSHPAVRERMEALKEQLRQKGFDDEQLRTMLWKRRRRSRRFNDTIGLFGCAFFCILVIAVIVLAVIGFEHLTAK